MIWNNFVGWRHYFPPHERSEFCWGFLHWGMCAVKRKMQWRECWDLWTGRVFQGFLHPSPLAFDKQCFVYTFFNEPGSLVSNPNDHAAKLTSTVFPKKQNWEILVITLLFEKYAACPSIVQVYAYLYLWFYEQFQLSSVSFFLNQAQALVAVFQMLWKLKKTFCKKWMRIFFFFQH